MISGNQEYVNMCYIHGVDLFIEDSDPSSLVSVGCSHAGRANLIELKDIGVFIPGAQILVSVKIANTCQQRISVVVICTSIWCLRNVCKTEFAAREQLCKSYL